MEILSNVRFDWLKYRWHFAGLSIALFVLCAADIYRKGGLRYGIDFSEGTVIYAKFQELPEIESVRSALSGAGFGGAVIQRYDEPELNQVMIRVERQVSDAGELDTTANRILSVLREIPGNPLLDSSTEIVGPVVGRELREKARNATLLALLAMLVYIGFRFEPIFGVGATVAVLHDVVITLGLVSLLDYEVSLNVIAAFLTLVGYSVNDTIVIFDRVRENRRLIRNKSLYDIVNLSINQTLSRTVITSGLTLLTVLALYIFGGEGLRSFAFVLVAGVIAGTYSTLAIASPIVVWWKRLREKNVSHTSKKTKTEHEKRSRI